MPEVLSRASMVLNLDSRLQTAGITTQTIPNIESRSIASLLFVMPEVLSRASTVLNLDSRLQTAGMTTQTIPNIESRSIASLLFVMPEVRESGIQVLNLDSRLQTAGMTSQTMSLCIWETDTGSIRHFASRRRTSCLSPPPN